MILKNIITYIKDAVFPLFCVHCKKEGSVLCDSCTLELPKHIQYVDPGVEGFSQVFVLAKYKEPSRISSLIRALKYDYVESVVPVLRIWMGKFAKELVEFGDDADMVISIPLHKRKQAERGYNQSDFIAKIVGEITKVPLRSDLLLREKYTKQQALMTREERLINIDNAFVVQNVEKVVGMCILLIDDVYTTGTTMKKAAEELLRAGAKEVRGLVLAKGE